MKTVDELKADIEAQEDVCTHENEKLYELRLRLAAASTPFKVGNLIDWDYGRKKGGFRRGCVTEIGVRYGDPLLIVRVLRRDGTPGAEARVRKWDNPRLVTEDGR